MGKVTAFREVSKSSHVRFWLGTLCAVLIVYLPGLFNQPVFDDVLLVDGTISERYAGLDIQQRMFSYGSFVWVEALFGAGLWKQRLVNVVLHIAVLGCLYIFWSMLVRRVQVLSKAALGEKGSVSLDTGLRVGVALFAVSPVAVYAVGYLVQRSILMATLFSIISMILFLKGLESRRIEAFFGAFFCYVLAVLSKEHAVLVVCMAVPLYVFAVRPPLKKVLIVGACTGAVLGCAVAGLYVVYGDILGVAFDDASRGYLRQLEQLQSGVGENLWLLSVLNQAALFFLYGFFWFVPNIFQMSIDMRVGFPVEVLDFWRVIGAAAYVSALVVCAWTVFKRSDVAGLAAMAFLFPAVLFATEFSTVWIQDPFVLYRSYLWAIGFPGVVCVLLVGFSTRVMYPLAVVVFCIFVGLALERNLSLKDEFNVWNDAVSKVDLSAAQNEVGRGRPFLNRGSYFLERGLDDLAQRDFEMAIRLGEATGSAHFNLGVVHKLSGDFDGALDQFRAAERLGFRQAGLHFHRGEALYEKARYTEALEAFSKALQFKDQDQKVRDRARLRRAESAVAARVFDVAIEDFLALLEDDPADRRLKTGLGMAYIGAQDGAKSLRLFDELIAEKSEHVVYYGRSMALMLLGNRSDALRDIEHAISLEPRNSAYRQLRSQLAR